MKKLLIALLILAACDDDNVKKETSENYIIFGHFYGECIGEQCVQIFKLTDDELFEDSNDTYPGVDHSYNAKFHILDPQKFDLVKNLADNIPQELLTVTDKVIGTPDAFDQGGIYFEVSLDGQQQYWLIDKAEANIPEYLRSFVEEVENSISAINN